MAGACVPVLSYGSTSKISSRECQLSKNTPKFFPALAARSAQSDAPAEHAEGQRVKLKRFDDKALRDSTSKELKELEYTRSKKKQNLLLSSQGSGSARARMQAAVRKSRKQAGAATADADFKSLKAHILSTGDIENPARGVNLYCDPENAEWFAVEITQPEPKQAAKVARFLEKAQRYLPPTVTLPSGKIIPRVLEIINPQKLVTAPSLTVAKKLTQKKVTWRNGGFLFLKAVMDPELALYMQPWFEDPSLETSEHVSFWFRRINVDAKAPLMTRFCGGETLDYFHIPKPCPQELLEEMNEWLKTEETWDLDAVLAYEYGHKIPSEFSMDREELLANDKAKAAGEFHLPDAKPAEPPPQKRVLGDPTTPKLENERRYLRSMLNESTSRMRAIAKEKGLHSLSRSDASGWNVGRAQLKSGRHFGRRHRPIYRPDGGDRSAESVIKQERGIREEEALSGNLRQEAWDVRDRSFDHRRDAWDVRDRTSRRDRDAWNVRDRTSDRERDAWAVSDSRSDRERDSRDLTRRSLERGRDAWSTGAQNSNRDPDESNSSWLYESASAQRRPSPEEDEVASRSGWFEFEEESAQVGEGYSQRSGAADSFGTDTRDQEWGWSETPGSDRSPQKTEYLPRRRADREELPRRRSPSRMDTEDEWASSSWFEGSTAPENVGGTSEGWYSAASAASDYYGKPRLEESGWYSGQSAGPSSAGSFQKAPKASGERAPAAKKWTSWKGDRLDGVNDKFGHQQRQKTRKEKQAVSGAPVGRDAPRSFASDLPKPSGLKPVKQAAEKQHKIFNNEGSLRGKHSSSLLEGSQSALEASQSFEADREDIWWPPAQSQQQVVDTRHAESSGNLTRRQPTVSSQESESGGVRAAAGADRSFAEGDNVTVVGGRYRGRAGTVVRLRQGVVRVQMVADEGTVEVDMALLHCKRVA